MPKAATGVGEFAGQIRAQFGRCNRTLYGHSMVMNMGPTPTHPPTIDILLLCHTNWVRVDGVCTSQPAGGVCTVQVESTSFLVFETCHKRIVMLYTVGPHTLNSYEIHHFCLIQPLKMHCFRCGPNVLRL